MKERTVKRYYCDHCKKSLGTKSCMIDHEKICLGNPARECRMCGEVNNPLRVEDFEPGVFETTDGDQILEAITKKANENQDCPCPACILSMIIQAKPDDAFVVYDYKAERDRFLAEESEMRWEGVGMP